MNENYYKNEWRLVVSLELNFPVEVDRDKYIIFCQPEYEVIVKEWLKDQSLVDVIHFIQSILKNESEESSKTEIS